MSILFISDSFVNSQEWTLSRSVPDLKLVSVDIPSCHSHKYWVFPVTVTNTGYSLSRSLYSFLFKAVRQQKINKFERSYVYYDYCMPGNVHPALFSPLSSEGKFKT